MTRLRAIPTLLRIGVAEAVAYRAEFFVWLLATNMPLIMWLLWSTVAEDGPVGRFGPAQFAAYFLTTLVVRLMTGAWVGWQLNDEIRRGVLQQRLMRPFLPFLAYALENIGAMPLRWVMLTPVIGFIAWYVPASELSHDPLQWLVVPLVIGGAWAISFSAMLAIGTISLYWQSSLALFELWLGGYFVFAGYLIPLELFPAGLRAALRFLPFPYILSLPVETILGHISLAETLRGMLVQAGFVAGFLLLAYAIWVRGLRRYEAYGG